jgi:hypothetical protein
VITVMTFWFHNTSRFPYKLNNNHLLTYALELKQGRMNRVDALGVKLKFVTMRLTNTEYCFELGSRSW